MRSLILGLILTSPLLCQSQESDRQTLPTLLSEVRQLRLAIERSTLLGTRMQIALQRIQMQETRAARVSQDLDRLRREVAELQMAHSSAVARFKNEEEMLAQIANPVDRKASEAGLQRFKLELEAMATREQQARAREAELGIQAQNEQGRLTELNDKVNQMERALDDALRQLGGQR